MHGNVVTIPLRDGITEGGLIVLGILAVVLAALIALVLIIWRFGPRIVKGMDALRAQVENDHKDANGNPIILRDDLDQKHDENRELLRSLARGQVNMQGDIAWIMRRIAGHDDRLDNLETTTERKRHDQPRTRREARRLIDATDVP